MTTKLNMLATYQMNFASQASRDPSNEDIDIHVTGENEAAAESFNFVFHAVETDGQTTEEVRFLARKVAHHSLIHCLERAIERVQSSLDKLTLEPAPAPKDTFPQSGGASA